MATPILEVHSHWNHYFENFTFSTSDFYKLIEEKIEKKMYQDVKLMDITLGFQLLDYNRAYLRVFNSSKLTFDICASKYGTDFFVSWWFGRNISVLDQLLLRIPIIRNLVNYKTYYDLDTEAIFSDSMKNIVLECVEEITRGTALKPLSELDRIPQKTSSKKK